LPQSKDKSHSKDNLKYGLQKYIKTKFKKIIADDYFNEFCCFDFILKSKPL